MTTHTETIAEIRERVEYCMRIGVLNTDQILMCNVDRAELLRIVDEQSAEITGLKSKIAGYELALEIEETENLKLTAEIERLTKERDEARKLAEHGRNVAWAYHKEYEPESGFLPTPLPWEKVK